MCFGRSTEPSQFFEYSQHMLWLRIKKNNFQLRALILGATAHDILVLIAFCEGLDGGGGGVWYSLFIKNLAYYSSH